MLLSGGIEDSDAEKVSNLFYKYDVMLGVDINSKFEITPGFKNRIKVERFINNIDKHAVRG